MNIKSAVLQGTVLLALGTISSVASAEVILNASGNLALGVNSTGELNTATGNVAVNSSRTGIAYDYGTGLQDATSPGCYCEGWGVSAGVIGGGADVSVGGVQNLTVDSFTSSLTNITSTVHLTTLPGLSVTQSYSVSGATDSAFVNHVTITNTTGSAMTDVRYVRVMDWDVPPTEFSEYVTIVGTATTTLLEHSNDNGFCDPNPLVACSPIMAGTTGVDFTDAGTADHGAYFEFNFGTLAAGASYEFDIFYGAAGSEADALAALAAIGPELYSLGQSSGGATTGTPATYFFAFKGVGGSVVTPPTGVPEPAALGLLSAGLLGFGALRARRRRA